MKIFKPHFLLLIISTIYFYSIPISNASDTSDTSDNYDIIAKKIILNSYLNYAQPQCQLDKLVDILSDNVNTYIDENCLPNDLASKLGVLKDLIKLAILKKDFNSVYKNLNLLIKVALGLDLNRQVNFNISLDTYEKIAIEIQKFKTTGEQK